MLNHLRLLTFGLALSLISSKIYSAEEVFNNPLPELNKTELFTQGVKDCKNIKLEAWHHPTQKVFQEMAVPLKAIQLCNNGTYAIFYIGTLPEGPPIFAFNDYFKLLFKKMRLPNGNWPFSLVDTELGYLINVKYNTKHEAEAGIERFKSIEN